MISPPCDRSANLFEEITDLHLIARPVPLPDLLQQAALRDIREQFHLLKKLTETSLHEVDRYSCTAAEMKMNRVTGHQPYRQSMVKLQSPRRFEGSIYINASFIPAYSEEQIIATQGPFSSTTGQFWSMVLEQKVAHVLMLCSYEEKGRPKCHRYLPESQPLLFEDLEVRILPSSDAARKLVQVEDDQGSITLSHQLIPYWPDHQAPPSDLIKRLNQQLIYYLKELREGKRVLVHCHAGLGRTGTFLAMLHLLLCNEKQRLEGVQLERRQFSVFEVVRRLRECRKGMVHNVDQYQFLYNWLGNIAFFQ